MFDTWCEIIPLLKKVFFLNSIHVNLSNNFLEIFRLFDTQNFDHVQKNKYQKEK